MTERTLEESLRFIEEQIAALVIVLGTILKTLDDADGSVRAHLVGLLSEEWPEGLHVVLKALSDVVADDGGD